MRHSFIKMKSGDSLSTRFRNENLFRFAPSIFQVTELYIAVGGGVYDEEEIIVGDKASTILVDLSEQISLNPCVDTEFQAQIRQQRQQSLHHN